MAENACTNCAAPVPTRRPSHSGTHWCQKPECQAAKQRYYRHRKAKVAEKTTAEVAAEFVSTLLYGERHRCHLCGLEDAVPGFVHRNTDPMVPCFGMGNKGREITAALDVVHPNRAPSAARPESDES